MLHKIKVIGIPKKWLFLLANGSFNLEGLGSCSQGLKLKSLSVFDNAHASLLWTLQKEPAVTLYTNFSAFPLIFVHIKKNGFFYFTQPKKNWCENLNFPYKMKNQ